MKNQKGITLIALVITIIVLLILAGISIAMLTGDNGVLTKSRQAKADNELGAAKDQIALEATEALQDYYEATYVKSDTATYSAVELQKALVTAINSATITPVTFSTTPTAPADTATTASDIDFELTYNERYVKGTIKADGKLEWAAISSEKAL